MFYNCHAHAHIHTHTHRHAHTHQLRCALICSWFDALVHTISASSVASSIDFHIRLTVCASLFRLHLSVSQRRQRRRRLLNLNYALQSESNGNVDGIVVAFASSFQTTRRQRSWQRHSMALSSKLSRALSLSLTVCVTHCTARSPYLLPSHSGIGVPLCNGWHVMIIACKTHTSSCLALSFLRTLIRRSQFTVYAVVYLCIYLCIVFVCIKQLAQ